MEVALIVVLVVLLAGIAYAQWQRGVVRTLGPLSLEEEDRERPFN